MKNIELDDLSVLDDRYVKVRLRTCSDKVYSNFHGLNVPEGDVEYESFTVIFIDYLLVYKNKYYLQKYI